MATIELRLSPKIQKETGFSEVLIRLYHNTINVRAKSGVFVSPNHFEHYIDRKKTKSTFGVEVPQDAGTVTAETAIKKHYLLFERGEIVVRNRINNDDKKYHDAAKSKIDEIQRVIISAYNEAAKSSINSEWLQTVIDKHNHPEWFIEANDKRSFFEYLADFRDNSKKKTNGKREGEKSDVWKRNFDVLVRALKRYEAFIRFSDKKHNDFQLDIDNIDSETLNDFQDFFRNEYSLIKDYPKIFEKIPANTDRRRSPKPQPRGNNTICALFNKLKAFFAWLNEKKITTNNPFVGFEGVRSEKYGTPYYISIEERNIIADYDLAAHPSLAIQRDIFIFQCCIGCRVSDLLNMTKDNIINGAIEYIPQKTKDEKKDVRVIRVPLNDRAAALVNMYADNKTGKLFPFITAQKYNDAIKEVFTICGIDRLVTVLNPITGNEEKKPLNEIASSHLARRTFVGNLYKQVKDPNLVGSLSGHVEGSKAFARYRNIDEDMKKELVKLID